jgi:hypothetical protein
VTPDIPNPARGHAAGSGKHHKRLASDVPGNIPSAPDIQAQNLPRSAPLLLGEGGRGDATFH